MPEVLDRLRRVVGDVAPTLGRSLGGPAGGAVGTMVRETVGMPDASDGELADHLEAATPEEWAQLQELDLELVRAANADRADAREMAERSDSKTPRVLAFLNVGVVIAVLAFLVVAWIMTRSGEILAILATVIGAVTERAAKADNFFFGSTTDSRRKTTMIGRRGF